jgi:hypothetical protein
MKIEIRILDKTEYLKKWYPFIAHTTSIACSGLAQGCGGGGGQGCDFRLTTERTYGDGAASGYGDGDGAGWGEGEGDGE